MSTILGQVIKFLDDANTLVKGVDRIAGNESKSLSKKAKEGILQFPVICSNSIDSEKMMTINKALERQYSSFVQVVYTMNATALLGDNRGLEDHIKKFHHNMGGTSLLDVINVASTATAKYSNVGESYSQTELEGMILETVLMDGASGKIVMENRKALSDVLESFIETPLNDLNKPRIPYLESANTRKLLMDAPIKFGLPNKVLLDNDVKKSNELVPTTLNLRVNIQDRDGKITGHQDFIIGVKATLHPVSSTEVVNNLSNISKGKFFDFIRWTTGEISFVKDFVLNINAIKTDVVNKAQGSSGWWLALKRRAASSRIKAKLTNKGIIPNATLVINAEEVTYIKDRTGLDVSDPTIARKIMETFLLLGFVIVDMSTNTTSFLFDGNGSFETVSITGLERESNNSSNDFKEMMKLINKY